MIDLAPFFVEFCQSPEGQEALKPVVNKILDERKPLPEPTPIFFTKREACPLLHISMPTLDSYILKGFLTAKRIGSRILIPKEAIEKALIEMPNHKFSRTR